MPLAASQVLQCRDNYTDHFCCPDTTVGQVCLSVCPGNSFKVNNHYFSVLRLRALDEAGYQSVFDRT